MDPQCPAVPLRENLKIAASLRGLYDPECVFLVGHWNIGGVIASDLQKYAGVRSALVGLACRMLEARSKFRASGNTLLVANRMTDRLQCRLMRIVHFNVGENREVISGLEAVQMRAQVSGKGQIAAHGLFQGSRIFVVRIQFDSTGL